LLVSAMSSPFGRGKDTAWSGQDCARPSRPFAE
jgi:hypothetical protein